MVQGKGPRVAPRSDQVDAYRVAPINQAVKIGAYIGVPLAYADGQLFGTLCAIDPKPQSDQITQELPLVELMADLLSRLLQADLALEQEIRSRERAQTEAETDALTGLYNRRGWEKVLAVG
jgi:diguanylate cyclase